MKLLAIDDDSQRLESIAQQLETAGFPTTTCDSALHSLDLLENDLSIDALIISLQLKPVSGLELAYEASRVRPGLPTVIISNDKREPPALTDCPPNVFAVFESPVAVSELAGALLADMPNEDSYETEKQNRLK
jgi:DNA-binding NtrC family response regulator